MTVDARELAALSPEDLVILFRKLVPLFAARAEAIYVQNPEDNGVLAQPYSDIAFYVGECATVFDKETPELDAQEQAEPTPGIQGQAIPVPGTNPWGRL